MRALPVCLLCGLLLAASLGAPAQANTFADPFEIGVGARAMALGRAYVARPADLYGVFFNPASLDSIKNPAIGWMQTQILSDVNYVVGMGASPWLAGTVGVGYSGVFVPNIPVTTLTTVNGNQRPSQTGSTQYGNSGVSLNYATPLNRFFAQGFLSKIRGGAALKLYSTNFQGGGNGVNGTGGFGVDMDFGLLWEAHPSATLGFVQKNFLPDSLAKINWSGGGQTATPIETTTHIGTHILLLADKNALWVDDSQKITLDMDMEWGYAGRPLMLHWGLEWVPLDLLSLRVGMDQLPKPSGAGYGADSALTSGVGLRLGGVELDYAYRPFGDNSTNAAHFFAVSYDFGKAVVRPQESRPVARVAPMPQVPVSLIPAIEFRDVPRSHFAFAAISRLASLNLIGGFPDGTFRPNQPVTRAEVVAILLQSVDIMPQTNISTPFTDVSSVHWAAGYIQAAVERGIATGNSDGTFNPQEKITRAEAVAMLARFLPESKGYRRLPPYADIDSSHWAYPAIRLAYENNLLEFVAGNRFLPKEPVTRAELAWMISNLPAVIAK